MTDEPAALDVNEQLLLSVNAETYHAHPALSSSTARKLLEPSCPALAKYEKDNPKERDYFDFGSAVHTWALNEGAPPVELKFDSWRTNASKDAAKAAREAGRIPLLTKDYQRARATVEAIRADPAAGKLLAPGRFLAEHSTWWTDPDTGIQRRAMFDALLGLDGLGPLVVVDVKTTAKNMSTHTLSKTVAEQRYYQQDPWYRDGIEQLEVVNGERPAFVFVFASTEPPHLVRTVQLDDDAVWWGDQHNRESLEVWARCTKTNVWPGYGRGVSGEEIEEIGLPRWAQN